MGKLADLNVRIGATIKGLTDGLNKAERALKRSARKMEQIGTDLTTRVSLPLVGIGASAVKAFADFEKLEKSLEAVAGSSEAAQEQLTRLQTLALQPGIDLENAAKGSIRLQAVGFAAQEAESILLQFSKAVTLAGGSGDDLNAVTVQLSQIISKGKLLSEDFNVIRERVPAIGIAMQDAFGTQNIERIRESGVSTGEFVAQLTQAIAANEKFQSVQGGLSNSFNNFNQTIKANLAILGQEIAESINLAAVIDKLTGFITRLVDGFKALNPDTKRFVVIAAAVAAAIGPVLIGIGSLVKLLPILRLGFSTLLGPVGLIISAIGLLTFGVVKAYKQSFRFRQLLNGLGAVAKEVFTIIKEAVRGFVDGFQALKKGNFKDAFASFGKSLIQTNPIGLALFEGKRLSGAFVKGAAETIENAEPEITDAAEKGIVDPLKNLSLPKFDTSKFATDSGSSSKNPKQNTRRAPELDGGRLSVQGTLTDETIERVKGLSDTYGVLNQTLTSLGVTFDTVNEKYESSNTLLARVNDTIGAVAKGAAENLAAVASSGESSFKRLGQAALKGAAQVARAKIIEAVTSFASSAFKSLGILGAPLALAAGGIVGGIFNSLISKIGIPALADGGITTGPTLALIGEAGREAVIPLDRLNEFSGNNNMTLTARVSGRDLLFLLENEKNTQSRITG